MPFLLVMLGVFGGVYAFGFVWHLSWSDAAGSRFFPRAVWTEPALTLRT
jgi:hypothetical protein